MKPLSPTLKPVTRLTFLILVSIAFQSCDFKTPLFPFFNSSVRHPDSSINHLIMLRKPATVPAFIGDAINDTGKFVILTNVDEMEYLIAYADPKAEGADFIGFEMTYLTNDIVDLPMKKVNIRHFATENGIYLNMPIKKFLKIKEGTPLKTTENGVTTYQYFEAPADFLRRHQSAQYIFECQEVEGKISRIRFGFVGPAIVRTNESNLLHR